MKFHSQHGSIAFTVIVGLVTASLASFFVMQSTQKQNAALSQAKVVANSSYLNILNINAFSRFKSILATRKNSAGLYIPALFAENYYASSWSLMQNPELVLSKAKVDSKQEVVLELADIANDNPSALFEAASGSSAAPAPGKDLNAVVQILETHFDKTNPALATAIKVRASAEILVQGKAQNLSALALINLQPPEPYGVILEASPQGANTWTRNIAGLGSGAYDFRVLGSGIAYNAEVTINGVLFATLGGFDANGKITHGAVHYLAKDAEIGRFVYTITNGSGNSTGPVGDQKTCTYTSGSVSSSLHIDVKLNGPSLNPAAASLLSVSVAIIDDTPHNISQDDIYSKYCTEECPWDGDIYNRSGDKTDSFLKGTLAPLFRVTQKKLCVNYEVGKQVFLAKHGFPVRDWNDIVDPADYLGDYTDYYIYDIPSCTRHLLFNRTGCGCFAEDTEILLGDRIHSKPIHMLTDSDQIWSPIVGRSLAIRKLIQGPEKIPMLTITAGDRSVTVTGKHPFPTGRGIQTAFMLEVGDRILLDAGSWSTVESIQASSSEGGEEPIVWNLELEADNADIDAHHVVANGIVTGDLFIQNNPQP